MTQPSPDANPHLHRFFCGRCRKHRSSTRRNHVPNCPGCRKPMAPWKPGPWRPSPVKGPLIFL